MDFILYDLSLTEITQDNLQICLEEGENYEGIIGFNHIDYYKLENVFVTARQLNEPDSPPIQDIASLKKLVLYLLCFLNKPVIDPNVVCLAARVLMELCCTRGAAAYGLLNTTTLTGIASALGPILSEELKVSDRKGKKGGPSAEEAQDEFESADFNDDDDDEEDGPVVGSFKSSRAGENLTLQSLKSLVHDFSRRSSLFKQCPDEHPMEMLLDSLIGVAYLSAMKPKFADIDIFPVIYTYGVLSERNMMITCRSFISGLTITGRDHRMLDSFKAKIHCHKAAVKTLVYFVKRLPHITTEWMKRNGEDDRTTPAAKGKRGRKSGSRINDESVDAVLNTKTPKSTDTESLPFPSAYVFIVGALQRMILVVPDRAPTRTVAVESTLSIVSTLTETYECCTYRSSRTNCMDTLSHIMSFLVKLSKCSKIGYRAFSLDIITATLGTNWIWKPAAYFQEYCSSTINYFDPHFLLTTLMERCIDSAPTVRIRALSALCGLFETLSNTSPQAKCELLLNAALGTLVVEKSSKSTSPSSQKSKNIATIQKSLIEIFRECAMDDKPLVRSKSVQALGSALTLNWPKHISTEEARYKNFGSSLAPLSIANATSAKSSSNAASAPMEVEYVTMFVAEEDILVLGEKCNDSSLAVRKQAVSALSDLARSRTADSAILDAWVAAVLPMISDPESSVQVKVALSVQEILLDAVIAWARDVNRSYQGKKATSNSAGDNNDGEIYNPMDMSNIDTDCDGAWHILLRVSSTGQTRMLKANIAALVKQGVIAVSGVTVSTYGGSGGANNVPKLNMKDIIEAAKTACCFGIKPTSSSNQTTSETEMISKSGWILLEALVGQQYTFDDSTYLRNRKLDKTSVDFVVKCFAHKRQRSHQVLDEDDIRMLQVLEKLADNMVEEDILGMREELFPLLQAFSLSTDATSAGVTAMYALSRALAKHQNLAGSGQNPDATLTPGGNKKKSKGSKSQRDSRGGLAAADDMTDEQKEFWCNDVREWCGKLLSTAYIILDSFVQNKTIAAPSNQSNNGKKNSGSSSNTVISTVGLEGLPPAELTQAIVTAMNKIGSDGAKQFVKSAVFTLGEVCMLGFSMEEEEAEVLGHKEFGRLGKNTGGSNSGGNKGLYPLPMFTLSERTKSFKLLFPESLSTLMQVLMGYHLPLKSSNAASSGSSASEQAVPVSTNVGSAAGEKAQGQLIPSDVRAFSFITMGKFCLRNKSLATKLVNVFLRELNSSDSTDRATAYSDRKGTDGNDDNNDDDDDDDDEDKGNYDEDENEWLRKQSVVPSSRDASAVAVRSNALLVLGDMCIRYTHLVDRHVGMMAQCLQDPVVIVRRHAMILLTQLLLQDFLKWRGMLLFRFLATAADSDRDTAEFAKSVLKKTILSKYPDFFCQHFSEAIVVYNGWTDHPACQAAQASGSEGGSSVVTLDGVDLHGAQSKKARFMLYSFMAEGFTEEQKIHVTAKIVDDILGYAIDSNSISSNPPTQKSSRKGDADTVTFVPYEETLEDAFLILRSPLLKIGKKGGVDSGDDDLQDNDELVTSGKAAVAKAKSIVLKKLSRQHLVGHVLPVVMSLKHMLESSRSPLQGPIMELLVALVKSNKAEVDQALTNDPTLKAEIEYDLRVFTKSKERQTVQGADGHTSGHSMSTRRVTIVSDKDYDGASSEKKGRGVILQPSLRKSRQNSGSATDGTTQDVEMADRLVGSDTDDDPHTSSSHRLSRSGSKNNRSTYVSFADESESVSPSAVSSAKTGRRRSWGVTISGLDEAESNEPEQSRKVASALKATDSSTERDGILKRDVLGGGSSGSRSMERIDSIKPSALVTRPTSLVHATSSSFSSSSSSSVIMGSAPSVASSGSRRATSAGSSSLLAVGGTRPSSTSANVSFSDDPDSKRAKMNK